MLYGKFPDTDPSQPAPTPSGLSTGSTGLSRRAWLTAVTAFGLGAIASTVGHRVLDSETALAAKADSASKAAHDRITELERGSDASLLASADVLERSSITNPEDQRIVALLTRLFDFVLETEGPNHDMAGAIAVRSLFRLRYNHEAQDRRTRVFARADLPQTRAAYAR